MATKEEFIGQAGEVLSAAGFEMVDASAGDHIAAIRDRDTSVLVKVFAESLKSGEPVVVVRALAVTNFEAPQGDMLVSLLAVLSKLNSEHYFGTWYFVPDPPLIVLEHALLVEHMTPEEFVSIVGMLEGTADAFDDELSAFLAGETARETLMSQARERGMI